MTMLRDLGNSLWNYRAYPDFLRRKKSAVCVYVLLLTLIFWLLTLVLPFGVFYFRYGGLSAYLRESLPEFTMENGKLHMDEAWHYANETVYVDIDTDSSNELDFNSREVRTRLSLSDIVLMANSERAIYKAPGGYGFSGNSELKIEFSEFPELHFSKESVISMVPQIRLMLRIGLCFSYFMQLAGFLISALVIAVFGKLLARFLGMRLGYGQIFRLTLYSRSLPLLLNALMKLILGGVLPEFAALSFLYSIFVLSRVYRNMALGSGANAESGAPKSRDVWAAREDAEAGERRGAPEERGVFGWDGASERGALSEEQENEEKRESWGSPGSHGGASEQGKEPEGEKKSETDPGDGGAEGSARFAGGLAPSVEERGRANISPSDSWSFGAFAPGAERGEEGAESSAPAGEGAPGEPAAGKESALGKEPAAGKEPSGEGQEEE